MKTNMFKTAALTIAIVISASVSAQNTKSFKENQFTKKFDKIVKENFSDLASSLITLKEAVQFKPANYFDFTGELNESVIDLSELKAFVKFAPTADPEVSNSSESNEMQIVLTELKEFVQFKPQNESTALESELKKATEELALVVRYKPAS